MADYDGVVQVWDASTGQRIMSFEEHDKRVWSVDSARVDPSRLASGSDDLRGVLVGGVLSEPLFWFLISPWCHNLLLPWTMQ